MAPYTIFFTKNLTQIITIIECMASPEGTTIVELTKLLSLTRRSVFRLIRTIEHDLNIPVTVSKKAFGGHVTYRLPSSFVEKLSHITIPLSCLSFRQAILFHLILKDEIFQNKQ
jgi:hypothetical protein